MQEEWTLFKIISHTNKSFKKGDILTVSTFGNVLCNDKPYECSIDPNGYKYLCGKYLHRIIAEKFLFDWDPNKEVDHKDTNRLNNRVDNLCMCTSSENHNNPLTLKHQSESHKGQKSVCGFLGKKHSEEAKQKMKLARQKYLERKSAQT